VSRRKAAAIRGKLHGFWKREYVNEASSPETLIFCSQCGRSFPVDDLLRFGDSYVCADCKSSFVQRVREGVTVGPVRNYASFGVRLLALLIDGVILFVASLAIGFVFPTPGLPTPGSLNGLLSLATLANLLIGFGYYVFLLTAYGATLGKMAMGVKIVTADGGPLSFGRSTGRYFCANFLEPFTLGIGYLLALFDDQARTLHDRICGTRAIKTR
jgi:uncharacterized RDD family membrane protein YckC